MLYEKRVISFVFVFVMCLSICIPACAIDSANADMESGHSIVPPQGYGSEIQPHTTNGDEVAFSLLRTSFPNYFLNLQHNMQQTEPNSYIIGQDDYDGFRVGLGNFGSVGCEIAATYNVLRRIGQMETLTNIIRDFEYNGYIMTQGLNGSDPFAIGEYFDQLGIDYDVYKEQRSYNSFKSKVLSNDRNVDAYIVSFFTNSAETKLHTVMFLANSSGGISVYNRYNSSTRVEYYSSLDEISEDAGDMTYRFSVGYAIYG